MKDDATCMQGNVFWTFNFLISTTERIVVCSASHYLKIKQL